VRNTVMVMARPKKYRDERRAVTYRLPAWLLKAIESLADENRRAYTAEVQLALEEYLTRRKKMPERPEHPERKGRDA
jgi:hypothetical protein